MTAGIMLALILAAVAWRHYLPVDRSAGAVIGIAALMLAALVVLLPSLRGEALSIGAVRSPSDTQQWQAFDEAVLHRMVSDGKLVFVDVTAAWCLTCKANELTVLDRPPVAARLHDPGVIAMRADWTRPDPADHRLFARLRPLRRAARFGVWPGSAAGHRASRAAERGGGDGRFPARRGRCSKAGSRPMSFYQRYVIPRLTHLAMRQKQLGPFRQRVIGAAEGRVLEIGIGSGLNFPLYRNTVKSVIGLEPSPELLSMARPRTATAAVPITLVDASAEAIPLDSASIDTVVTTWTLCTIPNAPLALAEMRRMLKPGGALLFVEHGRAPEPGVARWQDRLDPLWSRLAGGCHLNRKMDDLISGNGFHIEALENARLPGPRTHTFLYQGQARPA